MFHAFETFSVNAAESLSNKIFSLGLVRQAGPTSGQEKPPTRQEKAAGPAAKKSLQAWPETCASPAQPSFNSRR